MPGVRFHLLAGALFAGLTVAMTWPQAARMTTHVNDRVDPLLNAWAQAWVLHQLPRDPRHLFDANIFHPERHTLAYSESLIVPALITAPVRWAGGSPLLAYNVSMLLAFALSGLTTAMLVRSLCGSTGAGIVAGIVFAFLPFRIDHYAHLQLQWAAWMPIVLLGLHRVFERGRARDAVMLGVAFAAQALSCLYYAIFFSAILGILAAARLAWALDLAALRRLLFPRMNNGLLCALVLATQAAAVLYLFLAWRVTEGGGFNLRVAWWRITVHDVGKMLLIGLSCAAAAVAIRFWAVREPVARRLFKPVLGWTQARRLAIAALIAVALLAPVMAGYVGARETVGERGRHEVGGAVPSDYLAAPVANRLYGAATQRFGGPEHRLFLGVLPVTLAAIALWRPGSVVPWFYLAGTMLAFDLSLGFNGVLYEWLYRWVLPFRGLRVASRAGLLVGLGVAILAGFGACRLLARVTRPHARAAAFGLLGVISLAEAWSAPLGPLARMPSGVPAVYRWLATVDPTSNIVEVPVGANHTIYMYYSTVHWHRLLNGYSGFFPASFHELQRRMSTFPSPDALEYLRSRQADYVLDHRGGPTGQVPEGLTLVRIVREGDGLTAVYRVERK